MAITVPSASGLPEVTNTPAQMYRVSGDVADFVHTDAVYNALIQAAGTMEDRLKASLENYQKHPDVQANLQQLQYDLQSWNLA